VLQLSWNDFRAHVDGPAIRNGSAELNQSTILPRYVNRRHCPYPFFARAAQGAQTRFRIEAPHANCSIEPVRLTKPAVRAFQITVFDGQVILESFV